MKTFFNRSWWRNQLSSSLHVNSIYLFGAMAVSSGTGFLFWLIAARTTDAAEIGIASTMIFTVNLLKSFAELGFASAIIYYSGKSDINRGELITTVVGSNLIVSALVVLFFMATMPIFAPGLMLIWQSPIVVVFVIFLLVDSILSLQDIIMLTGDRPWFAFWRTIACNVPPFLLLFIVLQLTQGFAGIFLAFAIPNMIVFVVTSIFVLPKYEPQYRLFGWIDRQTLYRIFRYGFANYMGNMLWGIPAQVLPIVAVNTLPANEAGYFAMNWTLINLILIIPRVVSTSMYVEISQKPEHIWHITFRAFVTIMGAILPLIVGFWFFSQYIIALFGQEYVNNNLTHIFLMGAIPFAIDSIYYVVLRAQARLSGLILFALLITILTLILISTLITASPLLGIALGWSMAFMLPAIVVIVKLIGHWLMLYHTGGFQKLV